MTNPKFHVGQRVAVLTSNLSTIIPETRVEGVRFFEKTLSANQPGRIVHNVWFYMVSGCTDREFAEWCLRPIDDDEYTNTEEEKCTEI